MFLLQHLLRRFVEKGRLTVIRHDGSRHSFGSGVDGPDVTVRFHDPKVERELFFNPELATAETYMDGRLTIENGGIFDLQMLFSVNRRRFNAHPLQQALRKLWRALRTLASEKRHRPCGAQCTRALRSSDRVLCALAR